jgi:asparagine synthase (glutamine-hydrolysing)
MCGIAGIYYFSPEKSADLSLIKRMCDVIIHRGPDEDGYHVEKNIGIGMRRLSIIDLSTGTQPIYNEDKSLLIVFNGEIYNFKDLRDDLEKKGHHFQTKTDTEAILHGYEEYGPQVLDKLNGMFGIAIWNRKNNQLFIARDRIGIKPIYYFLDNHKFVFGSEIKSILEDKSIARKVNHEALGYFLCYGYAPSPFTLFEGIKKLEPGHYILIDGSRIQTKKYWDVHYRVDEGKSLDFFKKKLCEHLHTAVQRRLISDVPLGAFLSGGMDSSAIVTMMSQVTRRPVSTYSIGFGGKDSFHNELGDAKIVADCLHTDHHEILVEPNVVDLLPKLIWHMDEPVADSSIIVTYLVSKLAHETVKVILSGVGGDELFGGYRRYLGYTLNNYYNKIPSVLRKTMLPSVFAQMPSDRNSTMFNYLRLGKSFINSSRLAPNEQYNDAITLFKDDLRYRLLNGGNPVVADLHQRYFAESGTDDYLNQILYMDLKTQLVDQLLLLTDKMSMATSLEARVPFLDHEMVEFAATIPPCYKVHVLNLRYVQREAMRDILPKEITKKKKMGFGCPIGRWIKDDLNELVYDLLSESTVKRRGFFNHNTILQVLKDHYNNRADYTDNILALLTFEIWHQQFID